MRRSAFLTLNSRSLGMALAAAVTISGPASATGFFINQQSVRELGRVDAGNTVAADSLGTIFFNPAGLTKVVLDPSHPAGIEISLASHLILPRSTQRDRGSAAATPGTLGAFVPAGGGNARNPTGPSPVPNFYAAMPITVPILKQRAALGVGFNAPFGLTTSFDPDWHGRYDAVKASLRSYNVSVVGATRVGARLSVGGGVDFQRASTLLASAIPNPTVAGGPTPATDAGISTKGHDALTVGFNLGVLYDIDDKTGIGVHYRSGMTHEIKGTSVITGLPLPLASFNGEVGARAELKLPAIATVGLKRNLTPDLILFGEYEWFDWSTFKEVRIRFADGRPDAVRPSNYRDAHAVAAGVEYVVSPKWAARGGVHHDGTPTVDGFRDTTVPDAPRWWLGLGTSARINNRLTLDLAFNHVFFRDTTIGLTRTFFDGTGAASAVRIDSDVSTVVNTIAADFRFTF